MTSASTLMLHEQAEPSSPVRDPELSVVTGAFGYTGNYITRKLISRGNKVLTLTGHLNGQNPFGEDVAVAPFSFENPGKLARRLEGVTTLYNTYWVRFPHGQVSYDRAIENTMILVEAALEAGVRRIVHISVTNASASSPLPYFRGKGLLENFIVNSKLSYAIIRPTLIFGVGDVLVNNIAWLLRRFPFFVVPGAGDYGLQPIYVDDLAELAIDAAHKKNDIIVDAAGPDLYSFDEMVRLIATTVGSRARIIHCGPQLALLLAKMVSVVVKGVLLTQDEIDGLMANLLVSNHAATGRTRLVDWLASHRDAVGRHYASELQRHFR